MFVGGCASSYSNQVLLELFICVFVCLCLLEDVQALIPTKCCPSCLSFKGWSLHREATQSKRHPPISEILCVRLFLNISILIYIPFVISMYGFNITGWGVGGGGVCEGVCGH